MLFVQETWQMFGSFPPSSWLKGCWLVHKYPKMDFSTPLQHAFLSLLPRNDTVSGSCEVSDCELWSAKCRITCKTPTCVNPTMVLCSNACDEAHVCKNCRVSWPDMCIYSLKPSLAFLKDGRGRLWRCTVDLNNRETKYLDIWYTEVPRPSEHFLPC